MNRFVAVALLLSLSSIGSAAQPQVLTSEIPFHDCGGLICIQTSLDGASPRTLLLDTGNVNSILTTEAAKALGWKLEPMMRNEKPVPHYSRAGEHRVGLDKIESEARFLVVDRSELGENPPLIEGTLAYTFFKDRVLQIDYPHHKLRLSDVLASPLAAPVGEGTLRLVTFGKKGPPVVVGAPFRVDGKLVHAQIDTCYTGTLLVYDAALDTLGLKKHGKAEFFPFTDGGVNMLAAAARNFGFGKGSSIDAEPTMYFVADGKNPVHQPDGLFEATVGNALFVHSVVTLDFHAMTLDVRPAD